jgi:hypothetical protein
MTLLAQFTPFLREGGGGGLRRRPPPLISLKEDVALVMSSRFDLLFLIWLLTAMAWGAMVVIGFAVSYLI